MAGCDINQVRINVNNLIDKTILGNAESVTKSGDRFIITYSDRYKVKTRDQAYNMALSKINAVNRELTKAGYSSKFGPYVTLDNSLDNRIVIHKNSLGKLIAAYELRNKAIQEDKELSELYDEVYGTPRERDIRSAQDRVQYEIDNNLEDEVRYSKEDFITTNEQNEEAVRSYFETSRQSLQQSNEETGEILQPSRKKGFNISQSLLFAREQASKISRLGFSIPNQEEFTPDSIVGIWRQGNLSEESNRENFRQSFKRRLQSGGGMLRGLQEAISKKGLDPIIRIISAGEEYPPIFVEGKMLIINFGDTFFKMIEDIKSESELINLLEYIASEELIHVIQQNIITVSEANKAYDELTPTDLIAIQQFYNRTDNTNFAELTKDAIVLEFLRMKAQEILFGSTTELQTSTALRGLLAKFLNDLFTTILDIFKNKPIDSMTNQLLNRMIDFVNNNNDTSVVGDIESKLGFSNDVDNVDAGEYQQLLNQRKGLLTYLKSKRKEEGDILKKQVYTNRINKLQEQIDSLENKDVRSFDLILKFAKSDIETVDKILSNEPSAQSIDYGYSLVNNYAEYLVTTFENIIEVLDDTEKSEFNDILGDLELISRKLEGLKNKIAADEVKKQTNQNVLDINGVLIQTSDVSEYSVLGASRKLTDISDIKNPIVQALSKIIAKAVQTKINLSKRFVNLNNELVSNLKKYQKSLGLKSDNYYDYMIQTDSSGKRNGRYVNELSSEYFTERNKAVSDREKFQFYIDNHNFSINEEAWKVREELLEKEFEIKYQDSVELSDIDINKGITIEEKIASRKAAFMQANSAQEMFRRFQSAKKDGIKSGDVRFFKNYMKSGRLHRVKVGEELVYPIEFKANTKWIDPKWTAIQDMNDTDPRKVFYNHFIKNIQESYNRMKTSDDWLDWSYIPEKSKKGSVLNQIYDNIVNSITQNVSVKTQVINPSTGEFTKSIPKTMVNRNLGVDEMSFDLGDVLSDFYSESVRFKEMYSIEDDVQMLLALLKKTKTYEVDRRGQPVRDENGTIKTKEGDSNLYRMALYAVDSHLYQESQKIQNKTNITVAPAKVKQRVSEIDKLLKDLDLTTEERDIAIPHILQDEVYTGDNEKISSYVKLGTEKKNLSPMFRTVTGSKIVNALIAFTRYRFLGFNPFGGLAELIQGNYSLNLAAAGEKWFDKKVVGRAMKEVIASMNPLNKDHKVKHLSYYFDAIGNHIMGADMQKNKLSDAAFAMYRAANYQVNNSYLVSMLMSKRNNIKDLDGNEHNLYDVLIVDKYGKMKLPDNFEQIFDDVDGKPSEAFLKLVHNFKEMLKDNRDRRSQYDPIELDATIMGRALGQFKSSWMIKGFLLRFQDPLEVDGIERKGFYRSLSSIFKLDSTINNIGETVKDTSLGGYVKATTRGLGELLKFSVLGRLFNLKQDENLSDLDISNLKMFVREASWALNTLIFITIMSALVSGDDDDENLPFYKYVINQSNRLLRDLTTYASPGSFISLTKNPMPFMSTVKDIFDLGGKALKSPLLLSDDYSMEDLGLLKEVEGLTPGLRQIRATYKKINNTIQYTD